MSTPITTEAPYRQWSDEAGQYVTRDRQLINDAVIRINTDENHTSELLPLVLLPFRSSISRVAFVWGVRGITGALLYDEADHRVLVHITSAKIGSTEQPPPVAQYLLELLDVPAAVIRRINNAAWGRNERYAVILEIDR